MTTLRPERPADDPMSYGDAGQFEVAVARLNDPLNDPLPGRQPAVVPDYPAHYPGPQVAAPGFNEPGFTEPAFPEAGYAGAGYGEPEYAGPPPYNGPEYTQSPYPQAAFAGPAFSEPGVTDPGVSEPPTTDPAFSEPESPGPVPPEEAGVAAVEAGPVPAPPPSDGGRAARRKAAGRQGQSGGGGHRARGRNTAAPSATEAEASSAPLSRVEARKAARAAKDSPGVVISRIVGELFITTGVVLLLFVTYQLWWTNIRAHQQANGAANHLRHQWESTEGDPNRVPGTFSPGQGFAIMYIPKLDVKAPIAQGVSKHKVLDKGMIGHYDGALNTAMPWDKTGNFGVAAHRNTHGEPFRYINHLVPGDKVVVETANTYYTYEITSSLPSTPPSNISVLRPIPTGSGFTRPGRYLTLTTCTPEFTSTNRLIVWGKLVEERPRSKGKPDAMLE